MNRRPRTSLVRVAALGVVLALLGVGCGGSGEGVTDPPPPSEPEPPAPDESAWSEQASGVSGAISRVQFLDETTGFAVQRNRQGRSLTLLRTSDGGLPGPRP